jgi:hypothetical protein
MEDPKVGETCLRKSVLANTTTLYEELVEACVVVEINGRRAKVRFGDGSYDWVNVRDLLREGA